ncbi:MAG: carbon-nitrogen hydrolase family protein [Gemmataceae bacterium]
MSTWKVAAVQMDCAFADVGRNLEAIRRGLADSAGRGARLALFPECALSGYCYQSLEEARPHAQPLPGPASDALAADCKRLGVFAAVGMLELAEGGRLFNACVLVGPDGLVASYRKIHLPFLGVDRFVTPGDRPFAVHDLGGLKVGLSICYDGSFPESARVLSLLGADLVVLATNWPTGARKTVCMSEARAMENHVYYAAVNRVGQERGFEFIGQSRVIDPDGTALAQALTEGPELLLAEIDPARARAKRVVKIPGEYEIDRVGDRRPEMYGPLTAPQARPSQARPSQARPSQARPWGRAGRLTPSLTVGPWIQPPLPPTAEPPGRPPGFRSPPAGLPGRRPRGSARSRAASPAAP